MARQIRPLNEASLDVRGRFMPRYPRLILNGITCLPQVDEFWRPVKDTWVLPGREVATTQTLTERALRNGWTLEIINNP